MSDQERPEGLKLPDEPQRLVRVVKRDISWENDVVDLPDASWPDDQKTFVKSLTPMVLMPAGVYVMVVWDFPTDSPKVLIVSHSIFHQLREWHKDFMHNVVDTNFQIEYIPEKGLVYHRVTSMGMSPMLDEPRKEMADAYINGLFSEAWVPDVGGYAGAIPAKSKAEVKE